MNIIVITDTSIGKSLSYQSIPFIIGGIVLIVSLIIVLIKDQVSWYFSLISFVNYVKSVEKYDYLLEIDIITVALIVATIKSDLKVWLL